MLKREYRLGSKITVKFTNSYFLPYFLLKTSKNNLFYNRFRFIVSKKVSKKAVDRNKLKRTFSACLEDIFNDIKTGNDFVFWVKKEALGVPKETICLNIKNVFIKGGFIK